VRGGTLTIDAPAASKQHRFPRAVTRNGAPVATIVHHADLAGATLHYDLETTPLHAAPPALKPLLRAPRRLVVRVRRFGRGTFVVRDVAEVQRMRYTR